VIATTTTAGATGATDELRNICAWGVNLDDDEVVDD